MEGKIGRKMISMVLALFFISLLLTPLNQSSSIDNEIAGIPTGWTDDINLSNNITRDDYPSITTFENNVYIVWSNMWGGDRRIFYRNSSDGGQTWNVRKQISTALDGAYPEITINEGSPTLKRGVSSSS